MKFIKDIIDFFKFMIAFIMMPSKKEDLEIWKDCIEGYLVRREEDEEINREWEGTQNDTRPDLAD